MSARMGGMFDVFKKKGPKEEPEKKKPKGEEKPKPPERKVIHLPYTPAPGLPAPEKTGLPAIPEKPPEKKPRSGFEMFRPGGPREEEGLIPRETQLPALPEEKETMFTVFEPKKPGELIPEEPPGERGLIEKEAEEFFQPFGPKEPGEKPATLFEAMIPESLPPETEEEVREREAEARKGQQEAYERELAVWEEKHGERPPPEEPEAAEEVPEAPTEPEEGIRPPGRGQGSVSEELFEEGEEGGIPGTPKSVTLPTADELLAQLDKEFDFPLFWNAVREGREDTYFKEVLISGDEPAQVQLQTIWYPYGPEGTQDEWSAFYQQMDFFGIDTDVIKPWIDAMIDQEKEGYDYSDVLEDLNERILYPLYETVFEAFNKIKPSDIPGYIVVTAYEEGMINLAYQEDLEEADREAAAKKVQADIDKRNELALEALAIQNQLGGLPKKYDLREWIPTQIDLDAFFTDLREKISDPEFQEQLRSGDDEVGVVMMDHIASSDEDRHEQLANFFNLVPNEIFEAYLNRDLHQLLESELFPTLEARYERAINSLIPPDIDGWFEFNFLDDNYGVVYYEDAFAEDESLERRAERIAEEKRRKRSL